MGHYKRRRAVAATAWDSVADWYAGWVGEQGSEHHRRLAIPAVLDLLKPRPGEQILDLLRQVKKLQRAAFLINCRKTRNEFTNAARIDVTDTAQVQKDLVFAFTQQTSDRVAKCNTALADRDLSFKVKDRNIASLAFGNIDISHFSLLVLS